MTKSDGTSRINAVHIGELRVDNLLQTPKLESVYALCEADSGVRFGRGTKDVWSQETIDKLMELLVLMERDIIANLFDGGEGSVTSNVITTSNEGDPPGL